MKQPKGPVVNGAECTGCRRCLSVCPSFVFDLVDCKSNVARSDWCIGCGHCGAVCSSGALFHDCTEPDLHSPSAGEEGPAALTAVLRARRSVRSYTADPVPQPLIEEILDVGRYAPTGRNSQNVHYMVIRSPEEMKELRDRTLQFYEKVFSRARGRLGRTMISMLAGRKTAEYLRQSLPKIDHAGERIRSGQDCLFYDAPVLILSHAESWDTCSSFNCSVALYHCSLAAQMRGLGSCFNGYLVNAVNHSKEIQKSLGFPAGHKCYAAMTLGFPGVEYLRLVRRQPARVSWR